MLTRMWHQLSTVPCAMDQSLAELRWVTGMITAAGQRGRIRSNVKGSGHEPANEDRHAQTTWRDGRPLLGSEASSSWQGLWSLSYALLGFLIVCHTTTKASAHGRSRQRRTLRSASRSVMCTSAPTYTTCLSACCAMSSSTSRCVISARGMGSWQQIQVTSPSFMCITASQMLHVASCITGRNSRAS